VGVQIFTAAISAGGIDHAIDPENVPLNDPWLGNLQHPSAKLVIDQIIVLEFALWCVGTVALEEIVENFRLADVGNRDDLDIVAFCRKLIKVSADLA
jgi:hypothetical protein